LDRKLDGPLRQWPVIVVTCGERSRYLLALLPDVPVVDNTIDSAGASKDFLESPGNRLRIEPSGEDELASLSIGSAPHLCLS
jgi:hypothetical protein